MKTIDAGLLATYRCPGPTIVPIATFTRRDAQVFRWISSDRDLIVDSNTYLAAPGFNLSSLVSTEGFAVDNAELKVLEDEDITRADILAGIWDGCQMEIAEVDWKAATPVKNILTVGTLGIFKPKRGYSVAEYRDIRQKAQGEHATVLQPTCRNQLGDAKCGKDITGAPFTVTGTLDSSTSGYTVTDAARTEVADYFGDGLFTFTSGLNSGLTQKVKTFSAGVFVFWNQFIFPIAGDETYVAVAGCRHRFQEDCIAKLANGRRFNAEPNKRNPDVLTAPAP